MADEANRDHGPDGGDGGEAGRGGEGAGPDVPGGAGRDADTGGGTGKGAGGGADAGPGESAGQGGGPGGDGDGDIARLRDRVAALENGGRRASHHRFRSFWSALLIVIGCVFAPLGVVAAWASQEVGDTDRYVATVAPLASDPAVQSAAANRVTDAIMAHIDLNSLLAGVAPADRPRLATALGKLGNSLENSVRSFVHDKAQAVVASDTFKTVWTDANRKAHDAVDKALTGSGGGAVQLTDNSVQLDLGPVVDQVKQRLVADGLSVAGKIPSVHTDITLVRSDDIGKVKTAFRLLQLSGFWLPVLALVLIAGGILLAARRRRTLIASALGVAFATALLGLALTAFRAVYLDSLPAGVSQSAAGAVYDALVRLMRTTVRMVVVLGLVIAFAAWVTGRGRRAVFVRQFWHSGISGARSAADRAGLRTGPVGPWVHRYRRWIIWILVGLALLIYLLWSYPTAWVVVGIALALLLALAIVEFLEEPGHGPGAARGPGHGPGPEAGPGSGAGTGAGTGAAPAGP
ncbi:hypothetical protein ACIBCM_21680 [Streptomyces sp. NPDC051018]|uniref:hypothetical protein n=1 Tax=Streptomyces sp. NPDC051018 TaxID=3365639 RepID=UPI0037B01304